MKFAKFADIRSTKTAVFNALSRFSFAKSQPISNASPSKKSSILRYFSLASVLATTLFMSGCATSRYEQAPGLTVVKEPTAEQGLVVVRLIDTESSFLQFNDITLAPENINEDKEAKYQELTVLKPMQEGNSLFTGILKPGRYSIQAYGYKYFLGYWISDFVKVGVSFGTFEVKAGQVTDLGTLIHYAKPSDDIYINTLTRAPNPDIGEVLKKHYRFHKFDTENMLTWDDDESAEEHESRYASVAQNPLKYTKIAKTHDQHTYFLSPLGVMLVRDHEGDWDLDAVDSNMFLTAIDKSADGGLLLGGYEGTLFYKPAEGEWMNVSVEPEWTIDNIEFRNANEAMIVRHNNNDVVVELATIQEDSVQLKELNRFEGQGYGWTSFEKNAEEAAEKEQGKYNYRIENVSAFEFEGRWQIGLRVAGNKDVSLFSSVSNLNFDYDKSTNVARTMKFDKRIDFVISTGDRLIGIDKPGVWSWSNKFEFYAYDEEAKKWAVMNRSVKWCGQHEILVTNEKRCETNGPKVKTSEFLSVGQMVKLDNGTTFTVAVISDFRPKDRNDKTYSHIRLLKSLDNGKTWLDAKANFPNYMCRHLVPQVTDRLLLSCQTYSSDFYESTDEGDSWKHVRHQEAF